MNTYSFLIEKKLYTFSFEQKYTKADLGNLNNIKLFTDSSVLIDLRHISNLEQSFHESLLSPMRKANNDYYFKTIGRAKRNFEDAYKVERIKTLIPDYVLNKANLLDVITKDDIIEGDDLWSLLNIFFHEV